MTHMAQRVAQFGTTIFTEMTQLAEAYDAVNLGQGFPDFPAPEFIKAAARAAIAADVNQYAPGAGRLRLRQAIAAKMARHYGHQVDPEKEVTVTHGATEALFATVMGLVDPGDEVILLAPYYDSYVPAITMAGGIPRFLTLRPPDWTIDRSALRTLFNAKTRAIIVNSPQNPTGKVFSPEELSFISLLCQQHDAIAIMDDVYEHLVFGDGRHHLMAAFPGMRDRTVTISSMGKSFSVTGWKVGWAVASPPLSRAIFRAHQFITFSGAAPLQEAAAIALEEADDRDYYQTFVSAYWRRREFLLNALVRAGLKPIPPAGTYFVMVDISDLDFADDVAFCRYLTKEIGVTAIPPSAFYPDPADGAQLARFAFCKTEAVLAEAAKRLQRLR